MTLDALMLVVVQMFKIKTHYKVLSAYMHCNPKVSIGHSLSFPDNSNIDGTGSRLLSISYNRLKLPRYLRQQLQNPYATFT